jgi:hypothetical protein
MTMTEHLCPACVVAAMPGDCQWQIGPHDFAKVVEVAR